MWDSEAKQSSCALKLFLSTSLPPVGKNGGVETRMKEQMDKQPTKKITPEEFQGLGAADKFKAIKELMQ